MIAKLGQGSYSYTDAAQLIGVNTDQLRSWFRASGVGLFEPDYGRVGALQPISFLNLMEALVLKRLRTHGFSVQHLRKVHRAMCEFIDNRHGFASYRLVKAGGQILVREASDDFDKARLLELLTSDGENIQQPQLVSEGLLKPYLEDLTFDMRTKAKLATAWRPTAGIIVDPSKNFGAPTFEKTGVAVHVLADAWQEAGQKDKAVADWYEVPVADVRKAARFVYGGVA